LTGVSLQPGGWSTNDHQVIKFLKLLSTCSQCLDYGKSCVLLPLKAN